MIPDTCGHTCSERFAVYDLDSCCWRTSQGTFPWASDEFSQTWPRAGTWDRGAAYERPTSAPRTDASGCSSLPTPTARDGKAGMDYRDRSNGPDLLGALLPTPIAHDDGKSPEAHLAMRARLNGGERRTITSLSVLAQAGWDQPLLPTPEANDASGGRVSREKGGTRPSGAKRAIPLATALHHSALTSPPSTAGPPSWEDQPLPGWPDEGSTPGSSSG